MAYCQKTHQAQMAARQINEELLMGMGADGSIRAYHVKQAMKHFGELAGFIHALAIDKSAEDEPALEVVK